MVIKEKLAQQCIFEWVLLFEKTVLCLSSRLLFYEPFSNWLLRLMCSERNLDMQLESSAR